MNSKQVIERKTLQAEAQSKGRCEATTEGMGAGHGLGRGCGGLGLVLCCEVKQRAAVWVWPCFVLNTRPQVVGAQVFDSHGAFGGTLNGDTVLEARLAICVTVLPLADLGIAQCADSVSQLRDCHCALAGQIFMELHKPRIYSVRYILSIAIARVAFAMVKP